MPLKLKPKRNRFQLRPMKDKTVYRDRKFIFRKAGFHA